MWVIRAEKSRALARVEGGDLAHEERRHLLQQGAVDRPAAVGRQVERLAVDDADAPARRQEPAAADVGVLRPAADEGGEDRGAGVQREEGRPAFRRPRAYAGPGERPLREDDDD